MPPVDGVHYFFFFFSVQANYRKECVMFLRGDLSGTIHRSNTVISFKPSLYISIESAVTIVVAITSH